MNLIKFKNKNKNKKMWISGKYGNMDMENMVISRFL